MQPAIEFARAVELGIAMKEIEQSSLPMGIPRLTLQKSSRVTVTQEGMMRGG
jgi:hypothetical protein